MKKGKILALVVSALLAVGMFGVFAGCAPKADEKEIYVAGFKGGYGDAWLNRMKNDFENFYAEEGYRVKLMTSPDLETVIQPQIKSGTGPDVVFLAMGREKQLTETLIKSKSLLDVSSLLNENIPGETGKLKDKILPGFLDSYATNPYGDGKTYMLPLFYSVNGLFYNKALFYDHASPYVAAPVNGKFMMPATWDEFLALGQWLVDNDSAYDLFSYPVAGYCDNLIRSMVASSAGEATYQKLLNYENVYDEANVKRVFETLVNIKPYFYHDQSSAYMTNQTAFVQNKVLFMPNGTWFPGEMGNVEKAEGFEYGYTAPFVFKNTDNTTTTPYAGSMIEQIYIMKDTKKADIAKKFVAFLYRDESIEGILSDAKGGVMPTVNAMDIAAGADKEDAKDDLIDKRTRDCFAVFDGGKVKPAAGDFATSTATSDKDWKKVYCAYMDTIIDKSNTKTPAENLADYIAELKKYSAIFKGGIAA